ncbi:MAG: pyridoxal-5'-phosphate-dependent protein subunit beta, partial [Chloroflexi bacterium]|nr:pyridoxal-5'-phosphate-dependent protein subunit beta [Chloroflexota bacterium]
MGRRGLEREVVDAAVYGRAVHRFRDAKIVMPTFAQLADPLTIPDDIEDRLAGVDPDAPDPLNLFRVHWFNDRDRRGRVPVPQHLVLPKSLT